MSKTSLLNEYKKQIETIKKCAKENGVSDKEINQALDESFKQLHTATNDPKKSTNQRCSKSLFKLVLLGFLVLSIFIYVLLNVHTPTSSIILRNVQGLTYPALKVVRLLSLPIIRLFPSLTGWYDESCLVKNPFFYVKDLDCSPCKNVHSVLDLTGVEGINAYDKVSEGIPFVLQTNQKEVAWKDLQNLYKTYSTELTMEPGRLESQNIDINSIDNLFNQSDHNMSSNVHIKWRINQITAARIVRKLFPTPKFFPDRAGQDVERFVLIDGPQAEPYAFPDTECSNVYILQGSGERVVKLKPSSECENQCRMISVRMKPSYILLYDWWYWRPISISSNTNSTISVAYINSYC